MLPFIENQISWGEEMIHFHLQEATAARHHEVIMNDLIVSSEVYSFHSYRISMDLNTLWLYITGTLHLAPLTVPPPLNSLDAMVTRHLATATQNDDTHRASLQLRAHHSASRSYHETEIHNLELYVAVLRALRAEMLRN